MACAVLVFWALGAYNRLMRLRAAVAQSFGSLDAHLVRLVALLGEFGAAQAVRRSSLLAGDDPEGAAEAGALQGAANQLSASLAVARARPLHPSAIAALAAARDVLHATWQSAAHRLQEPSIAHAGESTPSLSGGALLPASASVWQVRWDEHALQNVRAIQIFNDAVQQYNAGIAQFPANLLAKVFGFRAAGVL